MKKLTTIIVFCFFTICVKSQETRTETIDLTIKSPEKVSIIQSSLIIDSSFTNQFSFLQNYNVIELVKVCSTITGNHKLDNWYRITVANDANGLIGELIQLNDSDITDIELEPKFATLSGSNDYYEPNMSPPIDNRALQLIKAKEAWLVRTNNNVKIGVSGEFLYQNHEDLSANILYNEFPFSNSSGAFHGTAVAGFAGGVTNNNLGIASAGFNPKLLLYNNYLHTDINALIHAINQGVKVITVSSGVYINHNSYYQSIIDYGYDRGIVFVAGAGNGANWEINNFISGSCDKYTPGDNLGIIGSSECLVYPASLNHVISVTSVCHSNDYGVQTYLNVPSLGLNGNYDYLWKDLAEQFANNTNTTHTRNNRVDISAPGFAVPCLNVDLAQKYTNCFGTSFASPMVASAISLILSVNPCLSVDDVEHIIKTTASNIYSITENQKYIGKLGAGRIDLASAINYALIYKAMYEQNTKYLPNPISYTKRKHTILIGHSINSSQPNGWVEIETGAMVNYIARNYIESKSGFEAKVGSGFEWRISHELNSCDSDGSEGDPGEIGD
jgi:hypothetical protein